MNFFKKQKPQHELTQAEMDALIKSPEVRNLADEITDTLKSDLMRGYNFDATIAAAVLADADALEKLIASIESVASKHGLETEMFDIAVICIATISALREIENGDDIE